MKNKDVTLSLILGENKLLIIQRTQLIQQRRSDGCKHRIIIYTNCAAGQRTTFIIKTCIGKKIPWLQLVYTLMIEACTGSSIYIQVSAMFTCAMLQTHPPPPPMYDFQKADYNKSDESCFLRSSQTKAGGLPGSYVPGGGGNVTFMRWLGKNVSTAGCGHQTTLSAVSSGQSNRGV